MTVYKQRQVILPEKDDDQEKPGAWKEINQDRKAIRRIEKEHKDLHLSCWTSGSRNISAAMPIGNLKASINSGGERLAWRASIVFV